MTCRPRRHYQSRNCFYIENPFKLLFDCYFSVLIYTFGSAYLERIFTSSNLKPQGCLGSSRELAPSFPVTFTTLATLPPTRLYLHHKSHMALCFIIMFHVVYKAKLSGVVVHLTASFVLLYLVPQPPFLSSTCNQSLTDI